MGSKNKSEPRQQINYQNMFQVSIMIAILNIGLHATQTEARFDKLYEYKKQEEQNLIGLALDEQKEPPLFYDTFFPVVYEMELPTWSARDMFLDLPANLTNISQLFQCNDTSNSTDLWGSTLCPVTLKLNEILNHFAEEIKVFETFNASATKLDSQFSSCHEVKLHFSNHIIDEIEVELYLIQIILDCPMSDIIHEKIQVSQPNKTKYTELFQLFFETHISSRFRIVGYSKYAISTNTLLSLHTTELLDFLLDSFSWSTSINTCNSQRIPRLLVPHGILTKTLLEIEGKVEKRDLKLAIPISDISNYYKLQLADCVMTTSKSYIIRILVPMVKKSIKYKLININPIPFLNKDSQSSKTMICHHRTLEGSLVVNAQTNQPLARVKCEEAELCRVPTPGDCPLFSECYTALLLNDTNGMLESCHMVCVPYDPIFLPFIKRIRLDQFAVAGTSSADLSVICPKPDLKPLTVTEVPKNIGSLLTTLPCSCYLSHRSEKYEINGPCDFQLEMKPVRPIGWTYDILLERFHHKKRFIGKASSKSNGSKIELPEGDSEDDELNEVVVCNQSSAYPTWPIYLAFTFLFIGAVVLVGGFYTLRNVYIRIGQLEMSTALSMTGRPTFMGSEYNGNAAVAFNVASHSPTETVY